MEGKGLRRPKIEFLDKVWNVFRVDWGSDGGIESVQFDMNGKQVLVTKGDVEELVYYHDDGYAIVPSVEELIR